MDSIGEVAYWLCALARKGGTERDVAEKLVQMLIGTAMRTGHLPDMQRPQIRRAIEASAKGNFLAPVNLRCMRCETEARLIDWFILGSMPTDSHRQAIVQAAREGSIPLFGYLLQCKPGTSIPQPTSAGGTTR